VRSLKLCNPHPILIGDKNEKNEMGGACNMYGERKGIYRVWWRNLRERNHLGDWCR
jgi:hypothetical protein